MRRGCIACDNVKTGSDQLTICDVPNHPEKAPAWCPERKAGAAKPVVTWLLVAMFCLVFGVGGWGGGSCSSFAASTDSAFIRSATASSSSVRLIGSPIITA